MRLRLVFVVANKGIRIFILVQVCEGVVDLPMLGLIRTDIVHEVPHSTVSFRHLPVVDGEIWNAEVGIRPLGQLAGLDILDYERVGEDGFFFEVAYEAVTCLRRDEVGEKHAVEEDSLSTEDHELHEPARFSHLQKGKQVHTLIVSLL